MLANSNDAARAPEHPVQTADALRLALIAWIAIVIVRNAWLSDDCFVTFRIVDNFTAGRGLTWNPGQRVQAFTHPAWFFLVSAAYALTHEIYYTVLALSLGVSLLGLWFGAKRLAWDAWSGWAALIALSFSRAYIDYSSSGLENPLTHLLLFTALLGFSPAASTGRLRSVVPDLALGLLVWNRLDLALLAAPPWLLLMWRRQRAELPRSRLFVHAAIAIGPVLLWWTFAIFYFGFALPNTAYAKLGVDVTVAERYAQGFFYLLTLIGTDPSSALLLLVGLSVGLGSRESSQRALACGVLLYLLYIGYIGGDFMAGRFFAAPLVIAAALVARMRMERGMGIALSALFALAGLSGPTPALFNDANAAGRLGGGNEIVRYRVVDERRFYYQDTGLLVADRLRPMPSGHLRDSGLALAGKRGKIVMQVGIRGFFAGAEAVLIDPIALTDPFLARLPAAPSKDGVWKAGHIKRTLPQGYRESVKAGNNQLTDPKLARLYSEMQLITTGPLWSSARFAAIWRLNTGQLSRLSHGSAAEDQSSPDLE